MSLPCCNCYLSYGRDMAQRYKGPRRQIKIGKSLPLSARHEIAARAAHHGIAFSQYVSDLLAIAAGMPELARELSQAALAIPRTPRRSLRPNGAHRASRSRSMRPSRGPAWPGESAGRPWWPKSVRPTSTRVHYLRSTPQVLTLRRRCS